MVELFKETLTGLGAIGDAIVSNGASAVGQLIGFVFGGDEGGTGKPTSPADKAAAAKVGFAMQSQAAQEMAARAEKRGGTRRYDEGEGKKQPSQYADKVAKMYTSTRWDNSHRALLAQIGREGKIDLYNSDPGEYQEDAPTKVEPTKV
jgi:hypothetical protein